MLDDRWKVATPIILGLAMAGMVGGVCPAAEKPSRLEQIPGSDLKRVVLTAKAAQRLDIKTAKVTEQPVQNWLMVEGKVAVEVKSGTAAAAQTDPANLRVLVNVLEDPDRLLADPNPTQSSSRLVVSLKGYDDDDDDDDQPKAKAKNAKDHPPAVVIPIGASRAARLPAKPIQAAVAGAAAQTYTTTYEVTKADQSLVPGQRVYVGLARPDRDKLQKVIPYSAVIYDRNGDAWTYTNPAPLVFVRNRIDIEFIEHRRAVLKEGPDVGTPVVTTGAAVLLGIEQKFGQ